MGIRHQFAHGIVGHALDAPQARQPSEQRAGIFFARVTHQHFKVKHDGNLRHRLRQLAGANQQ